MSNPPVIVSAIDFGTTFSGYAFSFRHDYERDPLKISANNWIAGGRGLVSLKTPSTLLLTPSKQFHSFGYEAENKYSDLTENEEHQGWLYFRRFKMILHNNKELRRSTLVKDVNGETMPAMTIFSMAIRYLKDSFFETINKQMDGFDEDMVHWVLTVPAIWDDGAKQFMREAAKDAGIKHEQLSLALEPEAASMFCMKVPTMKISKSDLSSSFKEFDVGTRYMVLDLGGGTVDITVHEVLCEGQVKEIHRASGGGIGGTTVDNAFYQFLVKLFGNDVLIELKSRSMSDYLDLFRDFETKKRIIKPDSEAKVTMRLPVTILEIFQEHVGQKLSKSLTTSNFANTVKISGDKMQIDVNIFRGFFEEALDGIIRHTRDVLSGSNMNIPVILLVGGFSESHMVKAKIRETFTDKTIISPLESGLAVLKGAVLFGHKPEAIKSRLMKYTYGCDVNKPFIEGKHPKNFKKWIEEYQYLACTKCFDPFVEKGAEISVGQVLSQTYLPDEGDAREGIGIYASTTNPEHTSHPTCKKLGRIVLKYPNGGWPLGSKITVDMKFGGTEFTVSITDKWLGKTYRDSYDFLES